MVSFDSKIPSELSENLKAVCGTQNNAYTRLLEYRLSAVKGLWTAQLQIALDEEIEKESANREDALSLLKKQGLLKDNESASFSTRVSLLLVLPLIQSQSKLDSSLGGVTAELLLNCLKDCPPLSLAKEPEDCLNGIEKLLCDWLENAKTDSNQNQRKNAASAMVALAVARGNLRTFSRVVHMLQSVNDLEILPIADILKKLQGVEGGKGPNAYFQGSKHILCWGLEDTITPTDNEQQSSDHDKKEGGRSIASDGTFLYVTNSSGKGLAKIGTGMNGTLRGYVYMKNDSSCAGRIAYANGLLVFRPITFDKEAHTNGFVQLINRDTLKPTTTLKAPSEYIGSSGNGYTTVGLCSDGRFVFWLWCNAVQGDKAAKNAQLFMECFTNLKIGDNYEIKVEKPRVLIEKKEESRSEALLSRLRPFRPSSSSSTAAAALVALTGADTPTSSAKSENTTSCGLSLNTLLKTPSACDGNSLILIAPLPGASGGNQSRFAFSAGSGLPSLRTLASNLVFNVADGQYVSRSDLVDAPTCALARGASLHGMGACYDSVNHRLLLCGQDWVDEFFTASHQVSHHVLTRLCISFPQSEIKHSGNCVAVNDATNALMQHIGMMCIHQLHNTEIASPLITLLLRHGACLDDLYLSWVLDVLQQSVQQKQQCYIIAMLLTLQLLFKLSTFQMEEKVKEQLMAKLSKLLWQIHGSVAHTRDESNIEYRMQTEVCKTLLVTIPHIYPSSTEQRKLLHKLLAAEETDVGCVRLRDMILVEYASQLQNQIVNVHTLKPLRLDKDLVQHIIKICLKQTRQQLKEAQGMGEEELQNLLTSLPRSSACLQYLMALQNHLLRTTVLYKQATVNETENQAQNASQPTSHTLKQDLNTSNETLQELQDQVLTYATEVIAAAQELLEGVLETCSSVADKPAEKRSGYLQGIQKLAKCSMLGHLLTSLVTAMTHYNLRCLSIADVIMAPLVRLIIVTSQTALLMRSETIGADDSADLSPDVDIETLIGETISIDSIETQEAEEQGFLAGLKIPTPWTTGKVLESIHPVRDNYKYKETVHLPGARALYLRFDPRCSSQYDYDKLVVYAGASTGSKKVGEYGGNTQGFGSRSVLGAGWPKDLIKVEGDTATLSFEMRSGREHNTPDKAMWGFHVTVRAQEKNEDLSQGLPFLADLALALSVLGCTMLHLLYQGPKKTVDEEKCQHLLKSKLLQRCVWQSDEEDSFRFLTTVAWPETRGVSEQAPGSPGHKDVYQAIIPHFFHLANPAGLARIRMPSEMVRKLRGMTDRAPPHIRASIKEVIKAEILEETILSAAIKHLSLIDTLRNLANHEKHNSDEYRLLCDVMSEIYRKFYALIRQLQNIGDLEQRWWNEVEEIHQGAMTANQVFFIDYHLQEDKGNELVILCFLKDIPIDLNDLESAVSDLREKLDTEVAAAADAYAKNKDRKYLEKTRTITQGLLERLELLLQVTIMPEHAQLPARSRSYMLSKQGSGMVRSDTDVLKGIPLNRSMSLPHASCDDSILEIMRLKKRRRHKKGAVSILHGLLAEDVEVDGPPHIVLIDQLFAFIGSSPEKAVSCESFLSAAKVRWRRSKTRQQALVHMKELLTAAARVGGTTHLVAAVTSVLQHGPRIEELTCGGMAGYVREAFAETMQSVVQLAARYPIACCNSIGLLCIIPYTRAEEKCLVRSGLVHLLDKLCSLASYRNTDAPTDGQNARQRVSLMAWAGFQVLSNRCVAWEHEDGGIIDELEHSGLACQVSTLLTHHLARATQAGGNEAAGSEALQEVLSLLFELSKSKMGRAILSQHGCVSKLMSLLLDQRPSPRLVLVILQLCGVALPLMTSDDCQNIDLPAWQHTGLFGGGLGAAGKEDASELEDKPAAIASLLLAKLGDFLVPGEENTVASRRPSCEVLGGSPGAGAKSSKAGEKENGGGKSEAADSDIQDGRLTVYIHKRDDQCFHDVVQPLLSAENRPFRLTGGAGNMEKILRMDRDMTRNGKAEVTTEEAVSALRKAAKWAQMGLVVSTGPPTDAQPSTDAPAASDKKKTASDVVCKEKNVELARTDPVRPFISGAVANSLAAEVIALLHGLLSASDTHTAQTWTSAVEKVLKNALSSVPLLLNCVEELGSPRCDKIHLMRVAKQVTAALVLTNALSSVPLLLNCVEELGSPRCDKIHLMRVAKQVTAALAALGGFTELVKPGCTVQILGDDVSDFPAQVVSVSEQTGLATVKLQPPTTEDYLPTRYSDTVLVPLTRLRAHRTQPALPLYDLSMTECIVSAVQALLLPQSGWSSQLADNLPIHGVDAQSLPNQLTRLIAEIRSRACQVLALNLKELSFTSAFMQHSSASIDILKQLAKECGAGERYQHTEALVQSMRMLYRDCAKPPPPPSKHIMKTLKEVVWDSRRAHPPVRACLFSHGMTGITFLADPGAGIGLPRGTIVYASQAIPAQAPSFYWELEVCSFGDAQEESGAFISLGFMPAAEKRDSAWTMPVGTCLFHNNGRAVHYNGASLLQWRSVRLDISLAVGDCVGIGWERTTPTAATSGNSNSGVDAAHMALAGAVKGRVYFTHNGRRQAPVMEDVNGAMWPVVHLQKKNTRVRANFGGRAFAYAEGQEHRNAADECHDVIQEMKDHFGALPFNMAAASDSESDSSLHSVSSDVQDVHAPTGPPCRTPAMPKSLKEYQSDASLHYKLLPCYETFCQTGPDSQTQAANQEVESDVSDAEDEETHEDHYALLVKAWEQKVFPVIRRRFRNEAERRDGLEQIKGALQLGMVDIARQTVEFLYEENGGMPRDLHLPTSDDIKADLAKFTIDRVRKGTSVVIRPSQSSSTAGTTLLPKYAVRGMIRTFGLTGIVHDLDQSNELVGVETYVRTEGVLVRYWYPLEVLERPPQGYSKGSLIGQQCPNASNIHIHKELLKHESTLARMYCRAALLELISQCNSPALELTSCATGLGTAMAASAALLQELDVENLQLLSDDLQGGAEPHGTLRASNLTTCSSPSRCLASFSSSPASLLYREPAPLREELRVAIARAANQGEDYVIELSNQICMCLQTAPEMFACEEFPITENKICTDVHFPGASFLVVSCKADPKAVKKDTSLYKAPWARIFTYSGHRIKKSGRSSKQEVVFYPRDVTSGNPASPAQIASQFAPAIIPGDLVHIRVGVSPPPGIILTIHALPPQFSLALTYIETLVSEGPNFEYRRTDSTDSETYKTAENSAPSSRGVSPSNSKDSALVASTTSPWRTFDSIVITPSVLMYVCDLLCGYLWRTDIPALVKELVFGLLAQTLRMLRVSEDGMSDITPTCTPQYSPTMPLLTALQTELRVLYDEEIKCMPSATTVSGTGLGLGVGDTGRFSSYLQALMEVCLAVAEVTPLHPTPGATSLDLSTLDGSKSESASASSLSLLPSSPGATAKRKKLKAKRERTSSGSSLVARRSGSPRPSSSANRSPSPTERSPTASTSTGSVMAGAKPEEMLWFHRAITMSQILRYITDHDSQGHVVTNDAVADVHRSLAVGTAHSRLLVITGIPAVCNSDPLKHAISKTCRATGGLFKEEIYIPLTSPLTSRASPPSASGTTSSHSSVSGKKSPRTNVSTSQPGSPRQPGGGGQSEGGSEQKSSKGASGQTSAVDEASELVQKLVEPKIKGYAVIEVRCKANLESAKKALSKNKTFLEGLLPTDELVQISDETLNISTVNQAFLTQSHSSDVALEDYLLHKLLVTTSPHKLHQRAIAAFTDIFHSCFICEQRVSSMEGRLSIGGESGYICLTREQLLASTGGNLMYVLLYACKGVKKPLNDYVKDILRRYGVNKVVDKDDSDKKSKPSKKPSRLSPRDKPSKEKLAALSGGGTVKPIAKKPRPKSDSHMKENVLGGTGGTTSAKVAGVSSKENVATMKSASKDSLSSKPATSASLPKPSLEDEKLLTLDGFLQWAVDKIRQDVRIVWTALQACGFDLHLEKFTCGEVPVAQQMSDQWSSDMDAALVKHVNSTCYALAISPARLHPHEVYITEQEAANEDYTSLQGISVESLRLRFALLQFLNNTLETFFLPLIDLKPCLNTSTSSLAQASSSLVQSASFSRSTALLLARSRYLIFYDCKMALLNRVLNVTVKRHPDQAAPEIALDPLEHLAGHKPTPDETHMCSALRQLADVPSSQLCVRLASGGDPTYAFNVRFTGEQVHGTSGSFRHFLAQVARELESHALDLFITCPSAATHKNKGKYILKPGPMTYAQERLLIFFGQLLAMTIRADIPFGLDLLDVFWKNLVGLPLNPVTDLQDADVTTYSYIKQFEMAESEEELRELYADQVPRFVFTSLTGEEVQLIPNGRNICVSWENKQVYADTIRHLRMSELCASERVLAIRAGMSSILPLPLLALMTGQDSKLRTCGTPTLDLDFLKAHTMYQVGLMESDAHIQYFWHVLESFSQEELHKFIKLACNQERLPHTCPCRDGGPDTAHVPPYPMKIAPPDGSGAPDGRYIRVETCMFMIKLPQYSSQELMRERLLYAIHCRHDPLSG